MPESVQSCFELSIHLSVFFPARTIFISRSRQVCYTDRCMERMTKVETSRPRGYFFNLG